MHELCAQFTELGRHKHIEGMEHITAGFDTILEEIRRKPYDLLDATRHALIHNLNLSFLCIRSGATSCCSR